MMIDRGRASVSLSPNVWCQCWNRSLLVEPGMSVCVCVCLCVLSRYAWNLVCLLNWTLSLSLSLCPTIIALLHPAVVAPLLVVIFKCYSWIIAPIGKLFGETMRLESDRRFRFEKWLCSFVWFFGWLLENGQFGSLFFGEKYRKKQPHKEKIRHERWWPRKNGQ